MGDCEGAGKRRALCVLGVVTHCVFTTRIFSAVRAEGCSGSVRTWIDPLSLLSLLLFTVLPRV